MRGFLIPVLLVVVTVSAQVPVRARFDVTLVKPVPPERLYKLKFEKCNNGGSFIASGTPLEWTIEFAYGGSGVKVVGGPDWLNSFDGAFDIEGKPDHTVTEADCRLMVRSLLEDRFKLKVHREARVVAGYALVVGKHGPKLNPAKPVDAGGGVRINGVQQQSLSEQEAPDGWSMSGLAGFVSSFAGRPVVDKTGLLGEYSFSMRFAHTEESDDPDIATALQEQLGLKLVPMKVPLATVIIDHVEKVPTEN